MGSSHHLVSEAFYLKDPDGLEIKVYADRDRSKWPWRGSELDAAVLPLDRLDLLRTFFMPLGGGQPGFRCWWPIIPEECGWTVL